MGAALSTLRKYVRAEINDPSPERKMSTSSIIHDGGNNNTTYFQDQTYNFSNQGIVVGDVIYNTYDGGSLAVIRAFGNSGGSLDNDQLYVDSIDGGTDNDYDNSDIVWIYDRHAAGGLNQERFSDSEVEDAIAQAQKLVANRYGGVEKSDFKQDIKVMTKIDLVGISSTFSEGETITGGTNGHTAYVEYVGDDFLIISTMKTKVNIDGCVGTLLVGETVTGATNSYTAVVEAFASDDYVMLSNPTGTFNDDEVLTGSTSSATATVNEGSGYSSGLFAANETVTGGTSSATGKIKATYSANNIYVGQDLPTDLKDLILARWWDGSQWQPLSRDHIEEHKVRSKSSGDPSRFAIFDDKIWLWPNNSTKQFNELHLTYMAWDNALSADTDTTLFAATVERIFVLEAALMLSNRDDDDSRFTRIQKEIIRLDRDIRSPDREESNHVHQVIDWNNPYGDLF